MQSVDGKLVYQALSAFRTDSGDIRWDHVGIAVGGTVAVIVGLRITSRSVRWLFGEPRQKPTIVYVPTPVQPEVVAA